MIEEEGIVVETEGGMAKVAILKKSACEACAAAGVCHPGGSDQSFMEAMNPIHAKKGQRVKVVVAPQVYLKASIVLYGVPMAALIAGAILGKNLAVRFSPAGDSDLWAFLTGIVFLGISFFFIRMYNKKVERTTTYKPLIVEVLP